MKIHHTRMLLWGATLALSVGLCAGCHKAANTEAPAVTSANDSQQTNNRIKAIQNDPSMSPADKQRAIETLKSRQH